MSNSASSSSKYCSRGARLLTTDNVSTTQCSMDQATSFHTVLTKLDSAGPKTHIHCYLMKKKPTISYVLYRKHYSVLCTYNTTIMAAPAGIHVCIFGSAAPSYYIPYRR